MQALHPGKIPNLTFHPSPRLFFSSKPKEAAEDRALSIIRSSQKDRSARDGFANSLQYPESMSSEHFRYQPSLERRERRPLLIVVDPKRGLMMNLSNHQRGCGGPAVAWAPIP